MMTSIILKPHSTPATLLWLESNYEPVEGVCIPRNAMYNQYVEFCRSHRMTPVNAASFGKIIRQKFPGLTTRRLGTRGQSRYHYYGLAVKSNVDLYARPNSTRQGWTETESEQLCSTQRAQNRSSIPNPLFSLPTDDILIDLPNHVSPGGAATIHIMYTLHCRQLIDYSVHFQVKEVKEYLSHFWEGFPAHLMPLLENNSIASLIGVCDFVTYRAITHSIMPCVILEEVPLRRAEDAIHLAECILNGLVGPLANVPSVLRRLKLHAARTLVHSMRRQVSLNHLCSNLRIMLGSEIHVKQMITDWEHLDMQFVADEVLFSVGEYKVNYVAKIIISYCKELEKLLRQHPQLSNFGDWMKELVERCITSHFELNIPDGDMFKSFACHFILIWSSIGTRILRELTLLGTPCFGTFHLLYVMLTDYGAQLVESLIVEDRIHRLTKNIATGNPPDSSDFDAGTLCDAQCPCKVTYRKDEPKPHDMSIPIQSSLASPNFPNQGGDIVSDSCPNFFPDSRYEISGATGRYSHQEHSDYSSFPYCQPANGLDFCNPTPHLICRPSCSYQDATYNNGSHEFVRNPSSFPLKTDTKVMSTILSPLDTQPLSQTTSAPINVPDSQALYGSQGSYGLGSSGNCYYMVSTSLSGGHCYDNADGSSTTFGLDPSQF